MINFYKNLKKYIKKNKIEKTKDLILHIGFPKTGTSSIQRNLASNQKFLLKEGILYPTLETYPSITYKHMHWPVSATYGYTNNYVTNDKKHTHQSLSKVFKEISESKKINKVIISDEGLVSYIQNINQIRSLKKCLEYFNVKIICYVRKQYSYFESFIPTIVRGGYYINNLEKQLELDKHSHHFRNQELYNLNEILLKWEKVFGTKNIILRDYDINKFTNADIVKDFYSALKIKTDPYTNLKLLRNKFTINLKLPIESLFFWNLLNLTDIGREEKLNKLLKVLNNYKSKRKNQGILNQKTKNEIYELYYEHNVKLSDRFNLKDSSLLHKPSNEKLDNHKLTANEFDDIFNEISKEDKEFAIELKNKMDHIIKKYLEK